MRFILLIGCLLWGMMSVQSLSRVENTHSVQKRAASPQVYQGQQGNSWNQTQQFQWVKVNNQWVRRDGTNKLPGYSSPNVPYNQTGNQGRTTPAVQPANKPAQQPQRQDSTSSQGSIGWNPNADRALTQDLPKTTPRPTTTTTTTTTTTRAPQTPPSAHKPQGPTPSAGRAPFGSGIGGQQKPQSGRFNPDARLTYGGVPSQPNAYQNRPGAKASPPGPPAGPPGSNPWENLFH